MSMNALLRRVALCLWACAGAAFASTDCDESASSDMRGADSASGRQLLGQGISLYDSRRLDMAEKALQASLFSGLPDRRERSTAHRYLAFVYCTNKEWARCDAAFDAAFEARPSFALEEYELQGTPWREAYLKAQGKRGLRCTRPLHSSAGNQRNADANPHSFSLNSTVITAITPLLPSTGYLQMSNGAPSSATLGARPRSDHNIQLRVSPWANVNLNGKRLGVTPPLTEMKLPVGSHTIDLTNPGFETVRKTLKVDNDQTITITHDFDAR
ncbi:MAG: PEGA domain-containing protein [Acidovorax sp.]|uniref:PEGA domain-containing protein n=1 Tax=Acidovorax sp. TaxID=1872122 RepID=UPI00391BB3E6